MPTQSILKRTKRPVCNVKIWSAPDDKGRRNSFSVVGATISPTLENFLLYVLASPSRLTDEFLDEVVAHIKAGRPAGATGA
jgi:hypothetical protein